MVSTSKTQRSFKIQKFFIDVLWVSIFITLMAVVLTGCASTSTVTGSVAPVSVSTRDIAVTVETKAEDSGAEAQKLKELIISELSKNGWKINNNGLQLIATIKDITKVGRTARLIGGALAGRASVDVEVVLKNKENSVLNTFSVTGKSSGGTIFAGTTDQALEKAAGEIVSAITKQ